MSIPDEVSPQPQPEQTDNRPRPEDGEQDVDQDPHYDAPEGSSSHEL